MAILFSQQRKTTRYLIIGLGVSIFVLLLFWFFHTRQSSPIVPSNTSDSLDLRTESTKIDFQDIKEDFLEAFTPYQFIVPFESGTGRDNPFASSTESVSTSTSLNITGE